MKSEGLRMFMAIGAALVASAGCLGGREPPIGDAATGDGPVGDAATADGLGDAPAMCFAAESVCMDIVNSTTAWSACANGGRCVPGTREPDLCCPPGGVTCPTYTGCSPTLAACPTPAQRCRIDIIDPVTRQYQCTALRMAGMTLCGGAGTTSLACPAGTECGANPSDTYSAVEATNLGNRTSPFNPAFFCFPMGDFSARTLTEMSRPSSGARTVPVDRQTRCAAPPPGGDTYRGGRIFSNLGGCRGLASCNGGCIDPGLTCCEGYSCDPGDSCVGAGLCRRGGGMSSAKQCSAPPPLLSLDCGVGYRCGGQGCCPTNAFYFCDGRCYTTAEAAYRACGGARCVQCSP